MTLGKLHGSAYTVGRIAEVLSKAEQVEVVRTPQGRISVRPVDNRSRGRSRGRPAETIGCYDRDVRLVDLMEDLL